MFTGTGLINRKHNIWKGIITPCPWLSEIKYGTAFLQINRRNDCWFTGNQWQYSMFSGKKDCRLIWLIFHKAYKGKGHSRLFRLFVLGQYYTPRLSCCATVLQVYSSSPAQCQGTPLAFFEVFACDSVVCEMGAVQMYCLFFLLP